MATRLDVVNNWIQTDLVIDMNHHEDSADYLIRMMNNYTTRVALQIGGHAVRVQHIEMTTAMFDGIEQMHKSFPAFRLRSFRSLRPRTVIGTICGLSVYCNESLGHCVRFQYKDIRVCDNEFLLDPTFINHPKGASSPFIYS
jgi:hypothetical protein